MGGGGRGRRFVFFVALYFSSSVMSFSDVETKMSLAATTCVPVQITT